MNRKHCVEERLTRTHSHEMCVCVCERAAPTAAALHFSTRLPFSCGGRHASCWLLFSPTVQLRSPGSGYSADEPEPPFNSFWHVQAPGTEREKTLPKMSDMCITNSRRHLQHHVWVWTPLTFCQFNTLSNIIKNVKICMWIRTATMNFANTEVDSNLNVLCITWDSFCFLIYTLW